MFRPAAAGHTKLYWYSVHATAKRSVPILLASLLAAGQTQPPAVRPDSSAAASPVLAAKHGWFRPFVHNERQIWTSPLRLQKKDARWLLPLAATTGALIAADADIAGAFPNTPRQSQNGERLSRIGAPYTVAGIAGGAYLVGRLTGNERARETGRIGLEALAHSAIVTHALKAATGRERPEDGDGRGQFFAGRVSFPSGHSMMAWSLAAVVAHEYQDRKAVRYGAYAAAVAVSAGRMMARKHFSSDCLAGGAMGYAIGTFLYDRRRNQESQRPALTRIPEIAPQIDRASRTLGISLVWRL